MEKKIKIGLIAILIVGIVLVGVWWILNLEVQQNENILQTKEKYKIINQSEGIKIQIFSKGLPDEFLEFKINGWMGTNEGIKTIPLSNGIILYSTSCCQGNHKTYPYFLYITNPDKEMADYIPISSNIQTYKREL